jgi:hypothetical protein
MNENPLPNDNEAKVDALPQAQDTTLPQQPQPTKKRKRSSHVLFVVLALLIVAALGGAATLLAYKYYFPKSASPTQTTDTQPAEKKLTAAMTISLVKGSYDSEASTDSGLSVPIKVAGYDFYTGIDESKVTAIKGTVPYADSAVVVAKIAKILKEKGFSEKIVQNGNDSSMYIADYTQRDVVCQTTITKTYNNPTGDHRVDVACANMSDYLDAASLQKPLYTVYPSKESADGSTIEFVGAPKVVASKTAGYNTAQISMGGVATDGTVGVGGFAGLFYQTPDMKWHFFMGAQNTPQCTDYKTDDLKKAYVGTSCLGADGKEATVTL